MSENTRKLILRVGIETGWIGYMIDSIEKIDQNIRKDVTLTAKGSFQTNEQGKIVTPQKALDEQATWKVNHIALDTSKPENEWAFGLSREELLEGDEEHEPLSEYMYLDVMTGEMSESEF